MVKMKKNEVVPVQAVKACKYSNGTAPAPLTLNLSIRWR